jgi:hypothetical protein
VCFKSTGSAGPNSDLLKTRETFDSQTGELLDELAISPGMPVWKMYKRIPGGKRNIRTEFQYTLEETGDAGSEGEAVASAPAMPGQAAQERPVDQEQRPQEEPPEEDFWENEGTPPLWPRRSPRKKLRRSLQQHLAQDEGHYTLCGP